MAAITIPAMAPTLRVALEEGDFVGAKVGATVRVESIFGADMVGIVLDDACCIAGE